MQIIGLLGHQGVGKNHIAEIVLPKLLSQKNTVVLAFADHFKIDCISKHNPDFNKEYGQKDYDTRRLLQKVGTEEGREVFGYDIWIRTLHNWIKILNSRGVERFIISDLRFQNEVEWIKSLNGIIIKINAPNRYQHRLETETGNDIEKINEIKNHPSEVNIDKIESHDILVNNDYNDNIEEQLLSYINSYDS